MKIFLAENPQLMAEIDDRVRECLTPKEADDESLEGLVDVDDLPITLDS